MVALETRRTPRRAQRRANSCRDRRKPIIPLIEDLF